MFESFNLKAPDVRNNFIQTSDVVPFLGVPAQNVSPVKRVLSNLAGTDGVNDNIYHRLERAVDSDNPLSFMGNILDIFTSFFPRS